MRTMMLIFSETLMISEADLVSMPLMALDTEEKDLKEVKGTFFSMFLIRQVQIKIELEFKLK
jgi:hypothetical protein